MIKKGINLYFIFTATIVLITIAALFTWPWSLGLLFAAINIMTFVMETLMLKFSHPEPLVRRISVDNWWENLLIPLISVSLIASAILSVYDILKLKISVLPPWTFLPAIILLMSAFLILSQSLKAQPPHAQDKYGEAVVEGRERGPYDVVRHPMMLAIILGGISIPLFLGSGIGFIPIGVTLIAVIARVALEDDWRFNNYEWFYDYTKEVSYRLIPFIW